MTETEAVDKAEATLKQRSRFAFLLRPWCLIPVTLFAVLVAIPLGYRTSQLAGIPPIDEIINRETEGRFDIEPEQNAFTHYEAAWKQIPPSLHDEPVRDAVESLETEGWGGVPVSTRQLLDIHRPMLDEWKSGTALERGLESRPPGVDWGLNINVRDSRLICWFVALISARCLDEGRPAEAWEWLRAQLRFSRHLGNPGATISRSVGMSFHAMASDHVVVWGSHDAVTAEHLKTALSDLREIDRLTVANSVVLKCEYLNAQDLLFSPRGLHRYCRLGISRPGILDGVPEPLSGSYLFLIGEPDLCRILLRHSYANALSQCDLPRHERTLSTARGLFQPAGTESPPLLNPSSLAALRERSRLAFQLSPWHGLIRSSDTERARQAMLETCLAVELFRRRHGSYPDSLATLVPEFLEQVPRDPYGASDEDRLLMVRRHAEHLPPDADPPPTLPGLIVYSRGDNEIDDGGMTRPYRDICIRIPIPYPGTAR